MAEEYRTCLDDLSAQVRQATPVSVVNNLRQYIAEERQVLQSARDGAAG